MNALQDQGLGRLDRLIESHDPIGFFRPEELPSAELPGEASHVAEPLRLGQIGFAPAQRAHRRLQIIARAPERFLRAPLRYAEPNHEKRGQREKGEARYGLNGKRIRRRNEVVIKSQMESPAASRPGPAPPSHAAKRMAQRNRDTNGAVCRSLSAASPPTTAAATARTATA